MNYNEVCARLWKRGVKVPVCDLFDLRHLDDREITAGYRAGRAGAPEPDTKTHSRSYWHGWRNGMVDSNRRQPDISQMELAEAMMKEHKIGERYGKKTTEEG